MPVESFNALIEEDLEKRTQQLIDNSFKLILSIDEASENPFTINTIQALQKKIKSHLGVLSYTNLLCPMDNETQQLIKVYENLEKVLKDTNRQHQHKHYIIKINQLISDAMQWQAVNLNLFIDNVIKPFELLFNAHIEQQKIKKSLHKQKKHLQLFLINFMNDFFQRVRQKNPRDPTKQNAKFDKYFNGIGLIKDTKAFLLPVHIRSNAEHLLVLINDLLAQIKSIFWTSKKEINYLNRHLPKLIEDAKLKKQTFLFKKPRLAFIQPPSEIMPAKEINLDNFIKQNQAQYNDITQQLVEYEETYQEILIEYSPKLLIKRGKALLKDSLKKLDRHYPAPFAKRLPYSIFADPSPTHYDHMCAHYFDKIERIIQHKTPSLLLSNIDQRGLTNADFEYSRLINDFFNILKFARHKMDLINLTVANDKKQDALIRAKVRALAILSFQANLLMRYLSFAYGPFVNDIGSSQFIIALSDFLSKPIDNNKMTFTAIDELYFSIFKEMSFAPSSPKVSCYKATETIQLHSGRFIH